MVQLILLIGVPGSGKSSLAAQLQQLGYGVISTDQIRGQLFGDPAIQGDWRLIWREVERQLRAAVQSGPAVYDATNTKRRARRLVIRLARSLGFTPIWGFWLHPPLGLCLERNHHRSRQVPGAVIQRMYQQLWSAPPKRSEGLDLLLQYGDPSSPDVATWLAQAKQKAPQYGNCTKSSAKTEPGLQ